jgi:hypothetical protein
MSAHPAGPSARDVRHGAGPTPGPRSAARRRPLLSSIALVLALVGVGMAVLSLAIGAPGLMR